MKISNKVVFLVAALSAAFTADAQVNVYLQTNLVSSTAGAAAVTDPNLVDPWGISFSASSPFWVSDRLKGVSTLYNGQGAINATVVTIPPGSAAPAGALGQPTGQVKPTSTTAFLLANGKVASFIFDTDDGTIAAWNSGTVATTMVDNSASKAIYKGLAIGTSFFGGPAIYAANFHSGKIEMYNSLWANITPAGAFTDPAVPAGYAPFNIWNLNNRLYVTWAKQDANQFLDVAGAGNGYVSIFDQDGSLISSLIAGGPLNSPWGVAIAPSGWGAFGGDVLVGNFGDGRINAFDPASGIFRGTLQDVNGNPIAISGLWAIIFGNGGSGGDTKTLYFTAGVPDGSTTPRGILGSIAPPAAITSIVNAASELAGSVAPGEIVRINGQTVGSSPAVAATIPPATALATTLGGTSVKVNGTPAPIMYQNGGQTNIQIPYEVAGSAMASVVLTQGTQTTAAFALPVAATVPGIFTIDFSGTGQAVALNADGTVNSSSNPAARGSMIWLFATGEGVTSPADTDGATEVNMSYVPLAPVSVSIGGTGAIAGPAGSTPKDVSGVLEMQVTVPSSIPAGSAAVSLTSGGVTTTQATVVWVK